MIIGIGTDIIEIDRVVKAAKNEHFLDKYYTVEERKIFEKKMSCVAGNFAVKESVAKMLGTGFVGISPKDIEVLRDDKGKPYVNMYNNAKKMAEEKGIDVIHVSISDNKECAIAYVIGESSVKKLC